MAKFIVRLPKLVEFIETEVHTIEADSAEEAMEIVMNSSGDPNVLYEEDGWETREVWYHDMEAEEIKA